MSATQYGTPGGPVSRLKNVPPVLDHKALAGLARETVAATLAPILKDRHDPRTRSAAGPPGIAGTALRTAENP